jgi:coenzyme F420-dependent glucose-6-phosphate dehydrogenase
VSPDHRVTCPTVLNEHILGHRWPPADLRFELLEEAVEIVRKLWSGDEITHRGTHYTVENARLYDPPPEAPPIVVSAFGSAAAKVAARIGNGLWTGAGGDVVGDWKDVGGSGPVYAQLTMCWAPDRDDAVKTAHRIWPNAGIPGQLSQDLATPALFEQAASVVTPEMIAESVPCGPDPTPVVDKVNEMIDAGIDHVYFHQIGPDQEGFCTFWHHELRPALEA